MIDRLRGALDRLTRRIAFIGFLGLVGVALATVADGLLRWLFLAPIAGVDDLSHLAFAVIVISCFPAGLLQGHNVTIRFLGHAMGRRGGWWLDAVGALVTLGFFGAVAWEMVLLALDSYGSGESSMTIRAAAWPWWAVGAALFVLCVPVQAVVLAGHVRRAVRGAGPGGTVDQRAEIAAEAEAESKRGRTGGTGEPAP